MHSTLITGGGLQAEFDRRRTLHTRQLQVIENMVRAVEKESAQTEQELARLAAVIDEARSEGYALASLEAAATDWEAQLITALTEEHEAALARQQVEQAELDRKLASYRSLRNRLVVGLMALIWPLLQERVRREE